MRTTEFAIGLRELHQARRKFEKYEPRSLFYRAAKELVELALKRSTSLTLAESLAVLLMTWNKAYAQSLSGVTAQEGDVSHREIASLVDWLESVTDSESEAA